MDEAVKPFTTKSLMDVTEALLKAIASFIFMVVLITINVHADAKELSMYFITIGNPFRCLHYR